MHEIRETQAMSADMDAPFAILSQEVRQRHFFFSFQLHLWCLWSILVGYQGARGLSEPVRP